MALAPAPIKVSPVVDVMGTVTLEDMPVSVDGLGVVTPLPTVLVKTQSNRYLTEVGFHEGQSVNKNKLDDLIGGTRESRPWHLFRRCVKKAPER